MKNFKFGHRVEVRNHGFERWKKGIYQHYDSNENLAHNVSIDGVVSSWYYCRYPKLEKKQYGTYNSHD